MVSVEAHCPCCGHYFRQNAERVREGHILACPECRQSWAMSRSSNEDEIRRLLLEARLVRQSDRDRRHALQRSWAG